MKTITELQGKWWYRLVKVVFLLFFVIATVGPIVGIVVSYTPDFDNNESYALCDDGRRVGLEENGITLYSDYVYGVHDNVLRYECMSVDEVGMAVKALYPDEYSDNTNSQIGLLVLRKFPNYADMGNLTFPLPVKENYELIAIYESRNWLAIIGFGLLSILISVTVFELSRRIFYYVVLGKIRPEK